MIHSILKVFIACAVLSFIACDRCRTVDCSLGGDYVNIRLMSNGQNAVYGPAAFIDKDSIEYFNLDPDKPAYPVNFHDSTQSIRLYIVDPDSYILDLKSAGTDTLSGITTLTDFNGCCGIYKLVTVYWNDQEICVNECGEVIEVEI